MTRTLLFLLAWGLVNMAGILAIYPVERRVSDAEIAADTAPYAEVIEEEPTP
jgi:hypothetical protein